MSAGEVRLALAVGYTPEDMAFTSSNLTEKELVAAGRTGARVHLDSLTQIETWGRRKLGRNISIRLNQGVGAGGHEKWVTGGEKSKFGIALSDIPEAKRIANAYNLRITGLQQHIGSNVLDASLLIRAAETLLTRLSEFPEVTHLDFGGGFGVPYRSEEKTLDIRAVGKGICALVEKHQRDLGRSISCSIEPGRYLVAEAGSLLVSVVDVKRTQKHLFAGVNSGFNHLVRPVMYGAYHRIQNLSRAKGKTVPVTIAGNLCESGDIYAWDRSMVTPERGDVLAIRTAGSCGFSMASLFNMRSLPKEVVIDTKGGLRNISFKPQEYLS